MAREPARRQVGYDKTFMYTSLALKFEPLNSVRDALKQECRLARMAGSGMQAPSHLSETVQREQGAIAPRVSSATGTKRKLWVRQEYLASFRQTASIIISTDWRKLPVRN